jgi:hypothetical protein
MDPRVIKLTPNFINTHIPPPTFSNREYQVDMTTTQLTFALFSTYILFPLLYIIVSTGNIAPIMILWRFIQSGIFNTVNAIKEFLTDVVYSSLRIFGQYTFSTYTVVKNGREIYTASSMCFYKQSDVNSVYRIDRAKYNICKWIDLQCKQYRLENHGEAPELTETHNDIYDFIIHKFDNEAVARIHRGDFSGRTHTLIGQHYRSFQKRNQLANYAELTVCLPSDDNVNTPETFLISMKHPYDFLLEKNEILDKKFLQWKMYYEHGRADIANYIGQPFSKYVLTIPFHESMKKYMHVFNSKAIDALKEVANDANDANDAKADDVQETAADENEKDAQSVIYNMNDSHSLLVGSRYVVKVDSVLRCPVFESNDSQVYDIDGVLTSYYNCSESETDSDTKSESETDTDDNDNESDNNNESDSDNDRDDHEDEIGDNDNKPNNGSNEDDPEFEMIEDPSPH